MGTKSSASTHHPTTFILDIVNYLDQITFLQAGDRFAGRSGFITGNRSDKAVGILVCVNITESVLNEAIENGCNLIVATYPIRPQSLTDIDLNYHSDRCLVKAIKHDIAIYVLHNNLDGLGCGPSHKFAHTIELQNLAPIVGNINTVYKLTTFVPKCLRDSIINAFIHEGIIKSKAYTGIKFPETITSSEVWQERPSAHYNRAPKMDRTRMAEESALTFFVPTPLKEQALAILFKAHPYAEVPYTLEFVDTISNRGGSGVIGTLPIALPAKYFLKYTKTKLGLTHLKHNLQQEKQIKTIGIYSGNGSWLMENILHRDVDAFLTAGLRYSDFLEASGKALLLDIDHGAISLNIKQHAMQLLLEKFSALSIINCQTVSNPIHYIND